MITAIVILGVLGLAFGAGLAIAARKFAVEKDPRLDLILEALPGANCGACGFPGCAGYADAIINGGRIDKCPVGGVKAATGIGGIMGIEGNITMVRMIARLRCAGTYSTTPRVYEYQGPKDCRYLSMHGGGNKGCSYGCLGFGNCVEACTFGAMTMGEDGLPHVDGSKCTACTKCVAACPKDLLHIVREDKPVMVACKSLDRGAEVRRVCSVGCIGCSLCVKACDFGAVTVTNDLAFIDPEKCTNCGECAKKCPTKAITGWSADIEAARETAVATGE